MAGEHKEAAKHMYIQDELIFQVEAIALENPDGFTLYIPTMQLVTSGIVAAYHATQNEFGRSGIHACIMHAIYDGNGTIGGWRNPDGRLQYDSVRVFTDRDKAIKFGKKQKQYSIYDIDNQTEIVL